MPPLNIASPEPLTPAITLSSWIPQITVFLALLFLVPFLKTPALPFSPSTASHPSFGGILSPRLLLTGKLAAVLLAV